MSLLPLGDNNSDKKPGFIRRMGRGLWGITGYQPTLGKSVSEAADKTRADLKLPPTPIDYRQQITTGKVTLDELRGRHDMLQMNARVTSFFILVALVMLIFFVDSVLMAINLVAILGISASFQLLWSSRTWQLRRLHNATLSQFFDALGEDFTLILPIHKFPDHL